jgi:ribose transport system ATP-binding protein
MRDGSYIGTKVVKETTNDELISMMVGRELKNYYTRDFQKDGEVILKCENISDHKMVKSASFEVKKGEIVGFAGLVGAGRSEVMKCLFGLTKEYSGEIYIEGKKVKIKSPSDAIKQGIAMVPEDRKLEGLYHIQSVRFNSTIEVLKEFIKGIMVDRQKEEEITQKYIDLMSTKTPSAEQSVGKLSGGNQQKVMIGRWLATNPRILILDEPTRGVDVGAKSEIYAIMNTLAKSGMSIIMISSEMPELINMSDRVYVMCEGRITGCLGHEEITQEKIMKLAAK